MAQSYEELMASHRLDSSQEAIDATEVFSAIYTISGSVIAARKARKLTQAQLSELSGVQQADISRIENGNLLPTTATLSKLLLALGARMRIELVDEESTLDNGNVRSIQSVKSKHEVGVKNSTESLNEVRAGKSL